MIILPGDPAPSLVARGLSNPRYVVDTVAGRYLMIAVAGAGSEAEIAAVARAAEARRGAYDVERALILPVLPDTDGWRAGREDGGCIRWLFDAEGGLPAHWGVAAGVRWFLIDPMMRVLGASSHPDGAELFRALESLPEPDLHGGQPSMAPVLLTPRIFEADLCEELIHHHETVGGEPSGFMREVDGMTRLVSDDRHKKRFDAHLDEGPLMQRAREAISRRLAPQVHKAFQFKATRIERYLVACYDAERGGHFRPHRDNTTKGTAHRRFAVSINLNGDFQGGDLRFPEFGSRTYRPAPGGAVVFSCSLLHEATPVTAGRRFAFLPFLYDEAAARIRQTNAGFIDTASAMAAG